MLCVDLIVSDFDHTLFKRNHGLLRPMVAYLETRDLPVYIVTYRAEDQQEFIASQLAGTKIRVVGYGFAASKAKEPHTKIAIIRHIGLENNIVEVIDDDEQVVLGLRRLGYTARTGK